MATEADAPNRPVTQPNPQRRGRSTVDTATRFSTGATVRPATEKGRTVALNLPSWATDWKAAVLAIDSRLSPELERLVRTDEVLDAITVTHSLSRLIGRLGAGLRDSIPGTLGLPTARQVAQLQRSIDGMAETASETVFQPRQDSEPQ